MSKRKNAELKYALLLSKIEKLLVSGTITQAEMGRKLGVDTRTINRALRDRQENLAADVNAHVAVWRTGLLKQAAEELVAILADQQMARQKGRSTALLHMAAIDCMRFLARMSGSESPLKHLMLHGFANQPQNQTFNGELHIVDIPHALGPETINGKPDGEPLERLLLELDPEGNIIKPNATDSARAA